jgi:ABC-type amino acid transport substrate-binding protein
MECFYTLQTGNEVDFLDVVSTLVEQSDRRIGVICLAFGHGPKYDHVTNADAIVDVHAVSQRYFKEIVTAEGIKETPQYYTIQKAKQSEQTFSQDNSNLDVLSMLRHRTLGTMRKGILTVAAYTQFYPISYLDEKEQRVRGLDVDIMEAFAKAANLVISWVHIDRFDKIWDEPAHDRADVSIGGIANSMSRQRRETEWSIPYFYVDRALIFNLRNPVTNFPDGMQNQNFEAGSMLGTKHSIGWDDAKLQLTRIGKADLLTEGTTDQEDMKRLLNGEVIAVMRGSLVAYALQKKHPGLGVLVWKASSVLLPTDGEVFAYPTRSGSGVAMALSVFLAHIIATKEINQFTKKHNLLPS